MFLGNNSKYFAVDVEKVAVRSVD